MTVSSGKKPLSVGVGLRHVHYQQALQTPAALDFVEVHAENFFARGGASLAGLDDIAAIYPVSLHGTSLGLGSTAGISATHLKALASLVEQASPVMVSEHAAFTWAAIDGQVHHTGDLLPIAFNPQSLQTLADNVNRVQERLQRPLLVENLSAYITPKGSTLSETDFLNALVMKTDCQLLVDINNLAVNAFNQQVSDSALYIRAWIDAIAPGSIGEIHLAGCTPVDAGNVMVDDHSQRVSDAVWDAYRYTLTHWGAVPTLIEWDTDLPQWSVLLGEAEKARTIANAVLEDV